jgi:hypothetical protein
VWPPHTLNPPSLRTKAKLTYQRASSVHAKPSSMLNRPYVCSDEPTALLQEDHHRRESKLPCRPPTLPSQMEHSCPRDPPPPPHPRSSLVVAALLPCAATSRGSRVMLCFYIWVVPNQYGPASHVSLSSRPCREVLGQGLPSGTCFIAQSKTSVDPILSKSQPSNQ